MAYTIKIDLKSQTPVYKQLINSVETAIHNGEYRYGDLLPSMNELSLQLGISKETVKKAYSLMRDRGVISATQGKGFYVSSENSGQNPKILVLFDKLSTYKQVLFSSFSSTIGTRGEITIRLHNQQIDLLEYYIDENLDQFDYYVVTPHFPLDESTQRRAVKALMRIPNRKLILLDRCLDSLPGNYGVVYQDFTNDVLMPISTLSGGEKGRVALTKLMLKKDNVLLLDEPTNHLDMDSREVLEDALENFPGTILAISHDRYFINRFATKVCVLEAGGVKEYLGNYDDYFEKINRQQAPDSENAGMTKTAMDKEKRKSREEEKRIREKKNAIAAAEKAIATAEEEAAEMEAQLADPATYQDAEKAAQLAKAYQLKKDEIERRYAEWEELSAEE